MKAEADGKLDSPSTRLSDRWLLPARLAWAIILLMALGKLALGLPLLYAEKASVCTAPAEVCSQGESPTPEQAQALASAGLSLQAYAKTVMVWTFITIFVWWGIGIFIFWARPDDWLALLASSWMVLLPAGGYETQIGQAYPGLGLPADMIFNLGNILAT